MASHDHRAEVINEKKKSTNMKKRILTLAFITIASITQASTIQWGTGLSFVVQDSLGNPLTSYGVAFLVYTGGDGLQMSYNGTSWVMGNDLVVDVAGEQNSFGFGYNANGTTATKTFNPTVAEYPKGSEFAIVFFTGKGVNDSTLPTSGQWGSSGLYNTTAKIDVDPMDEFYLGANLKLTTDVIPVPEPVSMALFGVGAGVIALRRRFKNKKA